MQLATGSQQVNATSLRHSVMHGMDNSPPPPPPKPSRLPLSITTPPFSNPLPRHPSPPPPSLPVERLWYRSVSWRRRRSTACSQSHDEDQDTADVPLLKHWRFCRSSLHWSCLIGPLSTGPVSITPVYITHVYITPVYITPVSMDPSYGALRTQKLKYPPLVGIHIYTEVYLCVCERGRMSE